MKPNSLIANQAVSPVELLARLSHIKSSNEMSSLKLKQIKQLEDNLNFYEQYSISTLQNLKHKLDNAAVEVNSLKISYRNLQELGVEKFDSLQKNLEKTLNQYEIDRKKGEFMIKEMVQKIQQKMEKSILQKQTKSSELIQEYLHLNSRLQSIIDSLDSMEIQLISRYQKLRNGLNSKFKTLSESISGEMDQTERQSENLMMKLQQMEKECETLIERINEKKEKKRYQMHVMLEKMIEETIQSSHPQ